MRFFFLFLLAWLILPATPVQAHAQLLGSNPSPGQVLTKFPTTIELDFSEKVDIPSARAELINASGEIIATGTVRQSPTSQLALFVDVPAKPDGVYSLSWQVISAVDGHETNGTVAFSVGLNSPRASLLPPPGTPDPATDLPPAGEVILRWLAYLTIAVVVGSAVFAVLVWRPAVRASSPKAERFVSWDERVSGLLKTLILFGAIGTLFAMMGVLIEQALLITPDQTAPVWQTLLQDFGHHEGQFVWLRLLVLPLIALLSTLLPRAGRGSARLWWEIAGLGATLTLTYSLSGHNAALDSPFPIIGDWLHFTAMSAWLGGLLPLAIILRWKRCEADPESTPLLDRASHRFSRMALVAVIVLGLSGLYSALLQVRTLPALVSTRYGQAILVKSALFLALIGLGALNQLGILPAMARVGQRAFVRLGRSVRVELALGALVLVAAGGLVSLSPAYQALQADQRTGLHEAWQGGGVRMDFRVAPVQVGDNEFAVDIVDRRSGADTVVGTALLRMQAEDESTGVVQVEAKLTTGHRYSARGSYLSKMGAWVVLVIWRKPGFDDVTHEFPVDLVRWANETGQKVNPVPAGAASVDDGRTLYLTNCAPCHGVSGRGDGPAGRALDPAPADLVQHSAPGVHTDGQLFDWITGGYPGSAMPAFKDQLTDKQRWDLVNYLRTLGKLR